MFFILDSSFKRFENCIVKLSAKETKWTSLEVRTHPTFRENLISKYDFGPVKLPGVSRNGPQEPELVPPQVNEPVVDLEKVKATDYVRAISHSVSLPCLEPPSKKKKIAIKEDTNRDYIPKSSITTSSRGQKMVAMALKRPELSATNKICTVLESRGLPREKVEKALCRISEKTCKLLVRGKLIHP